MIDMQARHMGEYRINRKLLHADETFSNQLLLKPKLVQCLNGRLSRWDGVGLKIRLFLGMPKDCIEHGLFTSHNGFINLRVPS